MRKNSPIPAGFQSIIHARPLPELSACLLMATSVCLSITMPALAKNGAVEFAKYFNPLQKKGYLNESQDRIIKKRSFKGGDALDLQAASNREIGLFASLKPEEIGNDSLIEDLLARSDVNGLAVIFPWQKLEPVEDEFNWQPVDHLLDLAGKHNKSLILRISTCGLDLAGGEPAGSELNSDTPKWVFEAGAKSIPYTGTDGKPHRMPIFWDSSYLANWRNFVKALGNRYDKHPAIHSVGITGGGFLGGTSVVPPALKAPRSSNGSSGTGSEKADCRAIEQTLRKEFGMTQRQVVEHWKYVSDIFPKYFETARLNFDIDPPTPGRAGEDALDQISDYLIYRYGERVYLTRENIGNAKHGFDQYRVFLKFRGDTLTGYQLSQSLPAGDLQKVSKSALDDGISYAEIPSSLLTSKDDSVQEPLKHLACHIGYEIISQKATLPQEVLAGEPLKTSFTFINSGSAAPMRPSRAFDKDVASSYRIMIELRGADGKPAVLSLHTPPTPTNQWLAGKPVTYDEELKMPKLAPGEYSVFLWLVDSDSKRKLKLLDAISQEQPTVTDAVPLGKVKVVPNSALGSSSPPPQ